MCSESLIDPEGLQFWALPRTYAAILTLSSGEGLQFWALPRTYAATLTLSSGARQLLPRHLPILLHHPANTTAPSCPLRNCYVLSWSPSRLAGWSWCWLAQDRAQWRSLCDSAQLAA
eukprot:356026-Chlamydomonas_euryale.AAC.1